MIGSNARDRTHQTSIRFVLAALIASGLWTQPLLSARSQEIDAPIHILSSDGFVHNWLILGPFPNPKDKLSSRDSGYQTDYLQSLGGEARALLTTGTQIRFEGESGKDQMTGVSRARAASSGVFHFDTLFEKADYKLAYAFCYIRSDKDQMVTGYFGSNDDAKIWVNRELVHRYPGARSLPRLQ